MKRHIQMGDVQLKPGVPMNHLDWINSYTNTIEPDLFVDAGDFGDMPSLSYWDRGKLKAEGARIRDDFECVHMGLDLLHNGRAQCGMYVNERIITSGNHEYRINRAIESDAKWEGIISHEDLGYESYYDKVGQYLETIERDSITYSHFFQRRNTGKPYGGMMRNRLINIGYSHVAGHSPGYECLGEFLSNGTQRVGLVNGSCYLHTEDYKGPQDNLMHFRGIVVLNEVDNKGGFLPMPVSLEYLCRRYEGMSLKEFANRPNKWIVYGKADPNAMDWIK